MEPVTYARSSSDPAPHADQEHQTKPDRTKDLYLPEWTSPDTGYEQEHQQPSRIRVAYQFYCVVLLLVSYFLSQYDKFIISYFQAEILQDLDISSAGYGALTGYGTSVLSSFAVIPIAIFTDRSQARVWVLTGTIVWWSLMVIFQSLSRHFWQLICARLGMFLGQSASEAIAVSLIADIVPLRFVPLAESILYVGVYIGEAISSRISAVFKQDGKTWQLAFKAIGITGMVVAVLTRLTIREPVNKRKIVLESADGADSRGRRWMVFSEVKRSALYIMSLRSFWLITLSAAFRQVGGVIFGYYMPTLLQLQYPDHIPYLVTNYGIIVGTVGSTACMLGGVTTTLLSPRYPSIALYITAVGGILSWPFVVVLTSSRVLSSNTDQGLRILFGSLAGAYITAELWLGAVAATVMRLLPIRYKTLGYAFYALINLLIYSSGPEIVSIAQYRAGVSTDNPTRYIEVTRIILSVLIPLSYCSAAVGLLFVARSGWYNSDLEHVKTLEGERVAVPRLAKRRKNGFGVGLGVLGALVVGLTVSSYVLGV